MDKLAAFGTHSWNVLKLFWKRGFYILVSAALFINIGVILDRAKFKNAEASDFVNYTEFTVQNGREGDPVFYKICRRHDDNHPYHGTLTVYIVPNTNDPKQNVKQYSREEHDVLRRGECENYSLKPDDYRHNAGNYIMGSCITFKVRYGFEKTICQDSNIYTVYPQPADLESQIKFFEQEIETLKKQLQAAGGDMTSLMGSLDPAGGSSGAAAPAPGNSGSTPAANNPSPPNPPEPPCNLDLLGVVCLNSRAL